MSYAVRLWHLTVDALRVAFFRDVPAARLTLGPGAILGVALATLAPPLAISFCVVTHGEWSWATLPYVLMHIPLLLAAAVGAAYSAGRPAELARFFVAGLLASVVVDIAWIGASIASAHDQAMIRVLWALLPLPGAWLALALGIYAARSAGRGDGASRPSPAASCWWASPWAPSSAIARSGTRPTAPRARPRPWACR